MQIGFTTGQKALLFSGIAAVAGGAIYGFVHIHNLDNKPLPTPALPALR